MSSTNPQRRFQTFLTVHAFIGLVIAGMAHVAMADYLDDADPFKNVDASVFDTIFAEGYPHLHCPNAPTLLNELGVKVMYRFGVLPLHATWNTREDEVRSLPTLSDAFDMLALSGLDMREILKYKELLARDDRRGLITLLGKYLEPDLDKHNLRALEGYDPALCVNAGRDHVFRIAIDDAALEKIRGASRLYHSGRYTEYRAKLQTYLQQYPNLSLLHVAMGNACFAEGDLAGAAQWYRQGASANPANPMLGYSMALCHLADGNTDAAIDALTAAVTTCRTNLLSWMALDCLLPTVGGQLVDNRFRPRVVPIADVLVVEKGSAEKVLLPWLYYGAAAMVIWDERTRWPRGINTWDLEAVEYYKIAHLLGAYMVQKRRDPELFDPALERIRNVYEAGLLRQFVLYEVITPYRQGQRLVLLRGDEQAKMRDYIDRFVVRRRSWGPTAGGNSASHPVSR